MAYIKYNDSDEYVQAVVIPMQPGVVRIITNEAPNLSGFRMYLTASDQYPLDNGEYKDYTALHQQTEGWYELCSGSIATSQPAQTEEELAALEKQKQITSLTGQIFALKEQLAATDYQVIKAYEYSLVGKETQYNITALHSARQDLRDAINNLQDQLSAII